MTSLFEISMTIVIYTVLKELLKLFMYNLQDFYLVSSETTVYVM